MAQRFRSPGWVPARMAAGARSVMVVHECQPDQARLRAWKVPGTAQIQWLSIHLIAKGERRTDLLQWNAPKAPGARSPAMTLRAEKSPIGASQMRHPQFDRAGNAQRPRPPAVGSFGRVRSGMAFDLDQVLTRLRSGDHGTALAWRSFRRLRRARPGVQRRRKFGGWSRSFRDGLNQLSSGARGCGAIAERSPKRSFPQHRRSQLAPATLQSPAPGIGQDGLGPRLAASGRRRLRIGLARHGRGAGRSGQFPAAGNESEHPGEHPAYQDHTAAIYVLVQTVEFQGKFFYFGNVNCRNHWGRLAFFMNGTNTVCF